MDPCVQELPSSDRTSAAEISTSPCCDSKDWSLLNVPVDRRDESWLVVQLTSLLSALPLLYINERSIGLTLAVCVGDIEICTSRRACSSLSLRFKTAF